MSKFPERFDRSDIRKMGQLGLVRALTNRVNRSKLSLTPAAVGANAQSIESVTNVVCSSDDDVTLQTPLLDHGLTAAARVTGKNTVDIIFDNHTAGSLTPAAGNYFIRVNRG